MSHELANRNACHWLYKTLAKQHNIQALEGVNRRVSNPFQGTLGSEINLNNYRVNLETLSGFSSLPRNYTYSIKGINILNLNHIISKTDSFKHFKTSYFKLASFIKIDFSYR